jgi:peroxiredoxin
MANTNVGSRAPDFALADLQGQRWALRDFRGQPVLLVFLRHLG